MTPATAQEFMHATGGDEAAAASLAAQHNAMAGIGHISPAAPAPYTAPAAQPPAVAPSIDAEKIDARIERYASAGLTRTPAQVAQELAVEAALTDVSARGKQASWDQSNAEAVSGEDQRMAALEVKEMMTARNPWDYSLPFDVDPATRSALVQAQVPVWAGDALGEALRTNDHELARLSPEQIDARQGAAEAAMKELWGSEYEAKAERMWRLLTRIANKSPDVASILSARPELISTDFRAMEILSRVAEFQHRSKG